MDADCTVADAAATVLESLNRVLEASPTTPVGLLKGRVLEHAVELVGLAAGAEREADRCADIALADTPGRVTYRRRPAPLRARCSNVPSNGIGGTA